MEEQGALSSPRAAWRAQGGSGLQPGDGPVEGLSFKPSESRIPLLRALQEQLWGLRGCFGRRWGCWGGVPHGGQACAGNNPGGCNMETVASDPQLTSLCSPQVDLSHLSPEERWR